MDTPPQDHGSLEGYLEPIQKVLGEILRHARLQLTFSISPGRKREEAAEAPDFVVDFTGPDADLLLQKNGALLDALEYVVLKAVRLGEDFFGRITFDCQDWRWLRMQELRLAARVAAERVTETGSSFVMSPMSARERRIIHLALRDVPNILTASEGAGQERKVVIHPAKRA